MTPQDAFMRETLVKLGVGDELAARKRVALRARRGRFLSLSTSVSPMILIFMVGHAMRKQPEMIGEEHFFKPIPPGTRDKKEAKVRRLARMYGSARNGV